MDLHNLLRALADPFRFRILRLLTASPLCVQHLQTILDQPQVAISKQLAVLKSSGLVTSEKLRTWRLDRLAPEKSASLRKLPDALGQCGTEEGFYPSDINNLKRIAADVRPFAPSEKKGTRRRKPRIMKAKPTLPIVPPTLIQTEPIPSIEDHLL